MASAATTVIGCASLSAMPGQSGSGAAATFLGNGHRIARLTGAVSIVMGFWRVASAAGAYSM